MRDSGSKSKEDNSTYKQLAQMQPSSTNTPQLLYSPNVNEEVHILTATVANLNNKDINLTIYHDDDGSTWNDSTTIVVTKLKKDAFSNVLSGGNPLFMNDPNGTLAFEASDTDVTITIWGIIYDIS